MLCFSTLSLNFPLFRLIVAINKRAVNDFHSPQRLRVCITCAFWNVITCTGDFGTEQVLLQYRGEVWFLLVLWTSAMVESICV